MKNPLQLCFGLALTALLMCGCGSELLTPQAQVESGQVTFLVEGMTERLSIY